MRYICGGGNIRHCAEARLIGEQASPRTLRDRGGDATAYRLLQTKG